MNISLIMTMTHHLLKNICPKKGQVLFSFFPKEGQVLLSHFENEEENRGY